MGHLCTTAIYQRSNNLTGALIMYIHMYTILCNTFFILPRCFLSILFLQTAISLLTTLPFSLPLPHYFPLLLSANGSGLRRAISDDPPRSLVLIARDELDLAPPSCLLHVHVRMYVCVCAAYMYVLIYNLHALSQLGCPRLQLLYASTQAHTVFTLPSMPAYYWLNQITGNQQHLPWVFLCTHISNKLPKLWATNSRVELLLGFLAYLHVPSLGLSPDTQKCKCYAMLYCTAQGMCQLCSRTCQLCSKLCS